jgi:hypothetical protein
MSKPDPSHPAAPAPAAADPRRAQVDRLIEAIKQPLMRGHAEPAWPLIQELAKIAPRLEFLELAARAAAVIGFPWPLAREAFTPAPRPAPAQDAVDLVSFHVDLPSSPSGIHNAFDYTQVLALSFESARIKAPRARRILLTDEATRVPESIGVDEVRRFPLDRSRLMYERMRVQTLYLEAREAGRASVLMDSDVVVNQDPASVFGEDFDVGLTWRKDFPDAPFNGGMIFVAEGSAGLEFLRRVRACYDALAADPGLQRYYPRGLAGWWGDQFALAVVAGYSNFHERTTEGVAVEGLRVRFFPCDTHNYTMEANVQHPVETLRRKHFIHFKGNRKGMQAQYLDFLRKGIV